MSCDAFQEHLEAYRLGELDPTRLQEVREHLHGCEGCRDLLAALEIISEAGDIAAAMEPPPGLAIRLAGSGCERWLGLLFKAVDRELGEGSLTRLLSHLEACPSCRSAWADMTLMHQVTAGIDPPRTLLQRCLDAPRALRRPRILGRRTVIAAAYVLALLIGPPVTLARHEAAFMVERVSQSIGQELSQVAADGRGEARVMLWRTLRWTRARLGEIGRVVERLDPSSDRGRDERDERDGVPSNGSTDDESTRSGQELGGSDERDR